MDKSGEVIPHGQVFSPDLSDPCKSCTCDYGQPTGCEYMYCDAPACDRYEMIPGTCCGFICIDSTIEPPGTCFLSRERVDRWINFPNKDALFFTMYKTINQSTKIEKEGSKSPLYTCKRKQILKFILKL